MATQESAPDHGGLPFPLQDGETVLAVRRRHWIYLWPLIGLQILAAAIPVAIVAIILDALDALEGTTAQIFTAIALIYICYWLIRIALTWYRYQHDVWVITNQRLIDSHRRHPFDLSISTADLVSVQDMSVQRSGLLRTILDFGNIVCQTAAVNQDFMLTGIPDPRGTQAMVDRERDRERTRLRAV